MTKRKFGVVIDLTNLETNDTIFAILERFAINFYRFVDNKHEIKLSNDKDSLCEFLKSNHIKFTCEVSNAYDYEYWVTFELNVDTYIDVTDHIELRAKAN